MPTYHFYCDNPLIPNHGISFRQSGVDVAQTCNYLGCRLMLQPSHNVARGNSGAWAANGDWRIFWDGSTDNLQLRLEVKVGGGFYRVLIPNDSLALTTGVFAANTVLSPPGGGGWLYNNIGGIGGGWNPNNMVIPQSLGGTQLHIGANAHGASYGLAHIIARHPKMIGNCLANPAAAVPLSGLRDNLREASGPRSPGKGIKRIHKQYQNNRYRLHGVCNTQLVSIIVDEHQKVITMFDSHTQVGLGHHPILIREWN